MTRFGTVFLVLATIIVLLILVRLCTGEEAKSRHSSRVAIPVLNCLLYGECEKLNESPRSTS